MVNHKVPHEGCQSKVDFRELSAESRVHPLGRFTRQNELAFDGTDGLIILPELFQIIAL